MDTSQLQQHIYTVRDNLLKEIDILRKETEAKVHGSQFITQQRIDDAVAAWMNRFKECMGVSLRHFSMAVIEQIEQKTGVPFFNAEELSEDIETLFLEQMKWVS